MNNQIVMVPVHLDGFFLNQEMLVTEAFTDFSRLPFSGAEKDVNPDTANLSESLLSRPFQNQNLNLKPGIHLHWSLPDALTQGAASGGADDYPPVPNRWLVTRKRNGRIEQRWIVESDYLHAGLQNPYHSIAFPIATNSPSEQPFRYLGRQLAAEGWQEDATAQRLEKLTAVGYGEPAFAAFYPNCHSVFGCFDEGITQKSDLSNLSYQLIGWYRDDSADPLRQVITQNADRTKEELEQLIKDQFAWNIAINANDFPAGMVCYAELNFEAGSNIGNSQKEERVTVSIGNTGTEALSAYLAVQLHSQNPIQLEEQLENLFLQSQLQNKELDLGPRFQEARHEKGFNAEKGGSCWEIKPVTTTPETDNSIPPNDHIPAHLTLPSGMADALDQLNSKQQQLDQAVEKLKSKKHVLFADWYKYMLCAYPLDDSRDDYPDIDEVKYYIEQQRLPQISQAEAEIQGLTADRDRLKDALSAQIAAFNESTIASTILSKPLDKNTVDLTGLRVSPAPTWQENKPFSAYCLSFNGADATLTIEGFTGVQSLSLWVNLAAQNLPEATLLATEQSGALISKNQITNFWRRIIINGVDQPTAKPLKWQTLPKEQWFHLYVELNTPFPDNDVIHLFGNASGAGFLKGKLASVRVFNAALSNDEITVDQNILKQGQYQLKEVAGPRFWHPREPVVLLAGEAVEPSLRHGHDGRLSEDNALECHLQSVADYPLTVTTADALLAEIENLRPASGQEKIGFDTWKHQPWHPFLLEWKVEVFSMSEGGNLAKDNRDFAADFINANYDLKENRPKLTVKEGKNVMDAAAIFSGRCILTPYAKKQLIEIISDHLNNLKPEDGYQAKEIPGEQKPTYHDQLTAWFARKPPIEDWYATTTQRDNAIAAYEDWYLNKPVYDNRLKKFSDLSESDRLNDFNYALMKAYQAAAAGHFISQALGGFNNALLMHQQTLQLPVGEPLGFAEYRAFIQNVKEAIGNNTTLAPLPLNDFFPIRSGVMRLLTLQVIDSFGQTQEIPIENIIKSELLTLPREPVANTQAATDAWLSPRLVQPARINFRWLSAHSGRQELNTHPASTPICGWLLANHWDNSLAVYDQQGNPVGIIDREATLRAVPGSEVVVDPLDVINSTLCNVIQRLAITQKDREANDSDDLLAKKKAFLQDFITVTDNALEKIDPETFIHHQELALLMGRPMAIVRASIDLQLKGDPAVHHGWTVFGQDLMREERETDAFEKVKIPVRIGERGQLNDGVVGYWKEEPDRPLSAVFHTTADTADNDFIKSYEDDPLNINQSLSDPPETLTLLIDPRGEVHATTGILPTKSIHIPKNQYTDALKKISITFLSAPILTGKDETAIALPSEMGYEWSWLAKERFNWVEVARSGVIRKDTIIAAFDDGPDLWQELLDQGWIAEIDGNRAGIVPVDQRTAPELNPPFTQKTNMIQRMLDQGHIVPVDVKAAFKKQEIREGWLKLSPVEGS